MFFNSYLSNFFLGFNVSFSTYSHASDVMVNNLSLVEGQEGIDAFVNKRSPVWRHGFDKAHE